MASRESGEAGSRERILQGANRLLRRQGYSATTLSAIAKEGKAPMGSVYFHFPGGKEQLATEALRYGAAGVRAAMVDALGARNPADALAACATLWADVLEATDWAGGCPVAATALETSSLSEPLRRVSSEVFSDWEELLAQRLLQAGIDNAVARQLAELALVLLEGAELLVRVRRTREPLDRVAEHIRELVRTECRQRRTVIQAPR